MEVSARETASRRGWWRRAGGVPSPARGARRALARPPRCAARAPSSPAVITTKTCGTHTHKQTQAAAASRKQPNHSPPTAPTTKSGDGTPGNDSPNHHPTTAHPQPSKPKRVATRPASRVDDRRAAPHPHHSTTLRPGCAAARCHRPAPARGSRRGAPPGTRHVASSRATTGSGRHAARRCSRRALGRARGSVS